MLQTHRIIQHAKLPISLALILALFTACVALPNRFPDWSGKSPKPGRTGRSDPSVVPVRAGAKPVLGASTPCVSPASVNPSRLIRASLRRGDRSTASGVGWLTKNEGFNISAAAAGSTVDSDCCNDFYNANGYYPDGCRCIDADGCRMVTQGGQCVYLPNGCSYECITYGTNCGGDVTSTCTSSDPLIFVPGIAGSSLNEVGGGNLWLGGIFFTDRSRLTLDPQKQQANIIARDVVRKTTFAGQDVVIYEQLLEMLKTTGGYREYQVNNDPSRRTAAGCDLTQRDNKPNLFVFAYDWRKSNVENAAKRKDYIGCVQQFYASSKVNILAHSMGGLLARRYILDSPATHNVNKLVTIGTPWLGAPKAIYILETGNFFDQFIADKLFAPTFKPLVEFFPGVHQLLPSQQYVNLGGDLFGEVTGKRHWDVNGNRSVDAAYTSGQLTELLDGIQFVRSRPAQTGSAFHDAPGQDDWRGDQTGVEYHHIYGVQYRPRTAGKVLAVRVPKFDSQGNVVQENRYETYPVRGDGTVPLLSAERIGYGNLNAPGATKRLFTASSPQEDGLVEHTGLVQNPKVHDVILSTLQSKPEQAMARRLPTTTPFMQKVSFRRRQEQTIVQDQPTETVLGENYDLKVGSIDISSLLITDAFGKDTSRIGDTPFRRLLPEASIYETSEESVQILLPAEMPADQSYSVMFRSVGKPIEIESQKGKGSIETATQIIRYLDLNFPAGTTMVLKFTQQGVEDLRYDKDGDGVFESTIAPTASATGTAAQDVDAPDIAFSEKVQGTKRLVNIVAQDSSSGVKAVRYSLDGKRYQPYTTPLLLDPAQNPALHVIADDNLANRSEAVTYKPLLLGVTAARDSTTKEIVVTATTRNEGSGAVNTSFVLNTAKLNNKPTTTPLPRTVNSVGAGEWATISLRFPGTAAKPGARVTLSGSGTSHGTPFSGGITVAVP